MSRALNEQGLSVAVASRHDSAVLREVFAQNFGEVDDVVAAYSESSAFRPSPQRGVGDLTVAGLIYRHPNEATCSRSNVIGVCLRKRNVVIVVRTDSAPAAQRALAALR